MGCFSILMCVCVCVCHSRNIKEENRAGRKLLTEEWTSKQEVKRRTCIAIETFNKEVKEILSNRVNLLVDLFSMLVLR